MDDLLSKLRKKEESDEEEAEKDETFGSECRSAKNIRSHRTLEDTIESTLNFIYSRRKGKISIKPFGKRNG